MKNRLNTGLRWFLLIAFLVGLQPLLNAQDIETQIDNKLKEKFAKNGPGSVFW